MSHRASQHSTTERDLIEARLLVVAEMLEGAVAEVRRVLAEVKHEVTDTGTTPRPGGH